MTMQRTFGTTKLAHAARRRLGSGETLFTDTINGETWVSNRYWLMRLTGSSVAALFDHNDPGPGRWVVGPNDKTPAVTEVPGSVPNLKAVMPDEIMNLDEQVDVEEVFVEIGGRKARAHTAEGCPMFTSSEGRELFALDPRYFDDICADRCRRITTTRAHRVTNPVSVWKGTRIVQVKGEGYISWQLAGILMPVKVGQ
jgi:hypothetical protein